MAQPGIRHHIWELWISHQLTRQLCLMWIPTLPKSWKVFRILRSNNSVLVKLNIRAHIERFTAPFNIRLRRFKTTVNIIPSSWVVSCGSFSRTIAYNAWCKARGSLRFVIWVFPFGCNIGLDWNYWGICALECFLLFNIGNGISFRYVKFMQCANWRSTSGIRGIDKRDRLFMTAVSYLSWLLVCRNLFLNLTDFIILSNWWDWIF